MKIEFNQEELVEALVLLLEDQGFKADRFVVDSFRFVAGRGENGDRVEVELSKKGSIKKEPEVKVEQPDLPFEPDNKEEVKEKTKTVKDLFNS